VDQVVGEGVVVIEDEDFQNFTFLFISRAFFTGGGIKNLKLKINTGVITSVACFLSGFA